MSCKRRIVWCDGLNRYAMDARARDSARFGANRADVLAGARAGYATRRDWLSCGLIADAVSPAFSTTRVDPIVALRAEWRSISRHAIDTVLETRLRIIRDENFNC